MVAAAAYFQAAGATSLVGAAFLPELAQLTVLPKPAELPPRPAPVQKSAGPIIARNVFDSVTGPLTPKVGEPGGAPAEEVPETANFEHALEAPACEGIRLAILTESPDPLWSFAALQGPGETKPVIRRVGDHVGSMQVAYMGFNAYQGTPSVWLVEGAKLCQAMLFATTPVPVVSAAPVPEAAPSAVPTPAGAPPLPPDMVAQIQQISPTEFNVDRTVVDKILENQTMLMRSARIVPEQQDGKVVGVRLFGVRPDTLLGHLGLQNGDRLEAINGFNMSSPDKALEAYARLRTSSNLAVKVTRRGQPVTIDLHIK